MPSNAQYSRSMFVRLDHTWLMDFSNELTPTLSSVRRPSRQEVQTSASRFPLDRTALLAERDLWRFRPRLLLLLSRYHKRLLPTPPHPVLPWRLVLQRHT